MTTLLIAVLIVAVAAVLGLAVHSLLWFIAVLAVLFLDGRRLSTGLAGSLV